MSVSHYVYSANKKKPEYGGEDASVSSGLTLQTSALLSVVRPGLWKIPVCIPHSSKYWSIHCSMPPEVSEQSTCSTNVPCFLECSLTFIKHYSLSFILLFRSWTWIFIFVVSSETQPSSESAAFLHTGSVTCENLIAEGALGNFDNIFLLIRQVELGNFVSHGKVDFELESLSKNFDNLETLGNTTTQTSWDQLLLL